MNLPSLFTLSKILLRHLFHIILFLISVYPCILIATYYLLTGSSMIKYCNVEMILMEFVNLNCEESTKYLAERFNVRFMHGLGNDIQRTKLDNIKMINLERNIAS